MSERPEVEDTRALISASRGVGLTQLISRTVAERCFMNDESIIETISDGMGELSLVCLRKSLLDESKRLTREATETRQRCGDVLNIMEEKVAAEKAAVQTNPEYLRVVEKCRLLQEQLEEAHKTIAELRKRTTMDTPPPQSAAKRSRTQRVAERSVHGQTLPRTTISSETNDIEQMSDEVTSDPDVRMGDRSGAPPLTSLPNIPVQSPLSSIQANNTDRLKSMFIADWDMTPDEQETWHKMVRRLFVQGAPLEKKIGDIDTYAIGNSSGISDPIRPCLAAALFGGKQPGSTGRNMTLGSPHYCTDLKRKKDTICVWAVFIDGVSTGYPANRNFAGRIEIPNGLGGQRLVRRTDWKLPTNSLTVDVNGDQIRWILKPRKASRHDEADPQVVSKRIGIRGQY